jgi:biotin operon repressor/predicted nucleotidyltransferase
MEKESNRDKILGTLLRQFSSYLTITSMSRETGLSRVGVWKILKRLKKEGLIILSSIGTGKTNTFTPKLNWENPLLEKNLSLILIKEALKNRKWVNNFEKLKHITEFVLLYGSILYSREDANDVDILGTTSNKNNFLDIDKKIQEIQKTQIKKIHLEIFTKNELKKELKKSNKIFTEAIKKGVVLFGQEKFIKFIKDISLR